MQDKKKVVPLQSRYTNGGYAEIAQLVEHNLAKVGVASSSLVFRSNLGMNLQKVHPSFFVLPSQTRTRDRPRGAVWQRQTGGPREKKPKSGKPENNIPAEILMFLRECVKEQPCEVSHL